MGKILGIGVALLALVVGFLLLVEGREMAHLFEALRAQPLLSQGAWVVIAIVAVALVFCVVWLGFVVARQRQSAGALELRLDGVREGVTALGKAQASADADMHNLARTDPEDAIAALRQRLTEAERFTQVQQSRNEASDLQSRVDQLRAQQQTLKERLVPVLEKRRSVEQLFMELEGHQNDIERTLDEIASGDAAIALDVGLKDMMEFIRRSHGRCDDIERAAKVIAGLKQDYAQLHDRLVPFAAADTGVASRIKELHEARDRLAAEIDFLQRTPEGPLAERVQKFADDKNAIEERLAELNDEFSELATLRQDISGLFAAFNRALDVLAIAGRGDNAGDVDARTEGLASYIIATQAHLDDIERRLTIFGQLKTKLSEVRSRLIPLESEPGGVLSVLAELAEIRDQLAAKVRRLEESDDGSLAERVRKFTEVKRELEERVAALSDQCVKLATIRNDIAGLFEKLSSVVRSAAN
jgi:chromosome segregation ATPase